jgi:cytochrome b subunit of formate dehydrogenase
MSVLLAVAGLVLVRYLVPSTLLKSRGEATNAIHQAIGIVYGVAIGFTILVVWQHLDTAQATTQREASDVEAIYRHADQLHESDGNRVQELSRSYAEVVVEEEWPLLAHGQASPQAQNTADELRDRIQKLDPQTMGEQALYARMLTNVDELEENRGLRLLQSKEGVPPFLWIVLVITGIITVAFTYLFEIESPRRHMLLVAALAVVVALSLYTVRIIEYPFAGDVQASPEAFEMVLDRI